jgi:peptide/nickel transport system substrate-binding protein
VIADAIDDIVSLDPAEAYEFSGLDVVNNIYDGLIELDPDQAGRTGCGPGRKLVGLGGRADLYTFKMKAGLTFASGNPVRGRGCRLVAAARGQAEQDRRPSSWASSAGPPENVDSMVTADGDTLTLKVDKAYAPTFLYNCLTARAWPRSSTRSCQAE